MSQFPNLLRRSSFAAHDPLITRIYTSTPSSVSKYGDWGLKYPIHRKKGPRHIRFSTLDAGSAIGADWQSGEREARFMEQWGTGKVAWSRRDPVEPPAQRSSLWDDKPAESSKAYLPAIENMTEKEFEKYLDGVRAQTEEARKRTLEVQKKAVEKYKLRGDDGDLTMASLAMRGYTNQSDHADEMARMNGERIAAPHSTVLVSPEHSLGGIAYSTPQFVGLPGQHVHPSQALPGRVLDAKGRSQAQTNVASVVGVGGLTGKEARNLDKVLTRDLDFIHPTDWTQTNPDHGRGTFRVARAEMGGLPTVLNLANNGLADRYAGSMDSRRFRPVSRATKPKPFDTFEHNISFELVEPVVSAVKDYERPPFIPLGSREYVGRDLPPVQRTRTDGLGVQDKFGGARSGRVPGAGLKSLHSEEERQRQAQRQALNQRSERMVSGLLAKLGRPGPGRPDGSAAATPSANQAGRRRQPGAGGPRVSFRDAQRAGRQ